MRVKTYPVAIEDGAVVVYANIADLPPLPPNRVVAHEEATSI